jgi:PAS domain S-box-containing protein
MPQIVWSTRADGWNIYFNQQWVDYTGLTLEESYGAGWNKPFHPDDQQRAWDAWQNAVNNNGTYSIEVRLRRFDGEYRWWLIRGVPKIGENDEILKWFGTCTDIEDIKKTQDELRETNEYLENLFNYANAPIIVWDTDFRITQFNNAFEKLSGLNASDVIGKKIDILFPKDKIDYSYELINKTAIGEKWETVEIEILRQNGEVRIVLWNSANILDATQSQIVATIAQGHDITERKKAEEALIESDRLLRESQKIAALGSYRWDLLTGFWESSEILDDIFGIDAAYERSLKGWTDIIHPDWQEVISNYLLNEVVSKNQRFDKEYQIVRQNDGQKHWVHGLGKLELDTNNKPLKLVGTILDITERKLIENELKKSEINFRRSISESPLGIRIVTVDGNTIYANKSFLDIYDFDSLEEYTSTPAINRYTPESYTLHQERKKKRRDEVEVFDYEISINCKNGDIRHIKVSRKEILWNGNKHFQVINQDITEQRKAEEELRKLSIAVEQSPNAECITDTNGIIEYVNPITIKLTGYVKEELIGRKTSIFRSGKTPKQEYVELWETIKSGNVWKGELHNKKKNGELYWESTTISPIFNNQGEITHFLAIKVDITERKRIELELNKSEEQLHRFASHLQNVREEEKIAIAREIHDDLGQLLVALKIDTGLLKKNVIKTISESDTSEIEFRFDNLVTQINNSIKTARNIMNGLRPELLEMHGIVGALKEYLREFQERHGIDCEFDCDIVNLDMNPKQSLAIFRILQEALNNIVKHANATLVRIQLQISDNKLVLQITDNGVGFDKNNSGREDSYGMIGMKERVILLDGELDIISEIGHGTTVRVEIPYQK